MTIRCVQCGTALLRDDARFCNNCGAHVSPQSVSPSPLSSFALKSAAASSVPPEQQSAGSSRPLLREQMAHQPPPPARPGHRPTSDEPPSWMKELENPRKPLSPSSFQQMNRSTNPPLTNLPEPPKSSLVPTLPPQKDAAVLAPLEQPTFPTARELHVKVWEQSGPEPAIKPEARTPSVPENQLVEQSISREQTIADAPTGPLELSSLNPKNQLVEQSISREQTIDMAPTGPLELSSLKQVEHEPTHPLTTSAPPSELLVERKSTPPTRSEQSSPARLDAFAELDTVPMAIPQQVRPASQAPLTPLVPLAHTPGSLEPLWQREQGRSMSSQQQQETPPTSIPASLLQPQRRKRKNLVWLVLCVSLLVLVGAGVGAWIVVFHPFSVADVTNPQQPFQNTALGVSLSYPTGWTVQVDQKQLMIHFSDSSQTAQVIMSIVNGGDANHYVQQEVTKLGMTGVKSGATPATATFAGATWSLVRGDVQLDGASYTEMVFATVHGGRLFVIMQLAPQKTYDQEEQLVFSAMRSTLQFL